MRRTPYFILLIAVVSAATTTTTTITAAQAQILTKDPPQTIPIDGNATLSTRDVAIDPTDGILPANGTPSISTIGIDDYDIQSLVPSGMTIVITNDTATATSLPVTIGAPATATATDTSNGDNGDDDGDSNGGGGDSDNGE